ncbi:hypothetical protein PGT21_005157 [Puccinia graminis f. sp. tritici]|uniref:Uncharacterized protein n=1 Tax=Puccinia graminis f. sp. tritici TaxID=56615 RepID=A0A5B0MTZ4_PUCGR|nr:hypothetical protein PGT21_005157 [Puccinia graminis f. sp. tritici]
MVNTQANPISGLIDSFASLGNERCAHPIRCHEAMVSNELARLNNAYSSLSDGIHNRPDPLEIFNQVEMRTELLDQLRSKRFPSLRRQVIALSTALISPTNPQNDPISKLTLVLKVLSKLDVTLGKIKFAIACINPSLDPEEVTHDKDFKKAKQLICCRLGIIVDLVTGYVCELLRVSCRFIEDSGHAFAIDQPQKRAKVLTITDTFSVSLDRALQFMNKSESDFMKDAWRSHMESIDGSLKKFLEFLHRLAPRSKNGRRSAGNPRAAHAGARRGNARSNITQPSHQPQTTKSAIALIKLTRLFLAKLSKMSTDKEHFRVVTELNSRELSIFAGLTTMVSGCIEKLVEGLCGVIGGDEFEDIMTVHGSISRLQTAPKMITTIVNHIFVPVVHQADQPSHKMYYKAWFYQWNRLHQLAAENFLDAFMFNT